MILPRISAPASATFNSQGQRLQRFALALAQCGFLRATHLQEAKPGDLHAAVTLAMKGLTDRYEKRLRLWRNFFGVGFEDSFEGSVELPPHRARHRGLFTVTVNEETTPVFTLGKKLEAIEHKTPGMGESILGLISQTAQQGLGVWLPTDTVNLISGMCWDGHHDETLRMKEEIGEGVDEETMLTEFGIVTRKAVDSIFPLWTQRFPRGLFIDKPKVPRIEVPGNPAVTEACRKLAEVMKSIIRQEGPRPRINDRFCMEGDGHTVTSIILQFGKRDSMTQYFWDEDMQHAAQCGEIMMDLLGAFFFDMNSPESCIHALRRLCWAFEITVLLDELLCLLIEEDVPAAKGKRLIDIFTADPGEPWMP